MNSVRGLIGISSDHWSGWCSVAAPTRGFHSKCGVSCVYVGWLDSIATVRRGSSDGISEECLSMRESAPRLAYLLSGGAHAVTVASMIITEL
jgi:hypothetical protein